MAVTSASINKASTRAAPRLPLVEDLRFNGSKRLIVLRLCNEFMLFMQCHAELVEA
jgi:hypothetical protein